MKKSAVIFDRDGTLASMAYCAPSTQNKEDWRNYNSALRFDGVVEPVAGLLRSIPDGVTRIMTSGRAEGDRPGDRHRKFALQDWLYKHSLPIDLLIMREGGDQRIDSVVKQEMYFEQIEPYYNVLLVVDDRQQVVDMWRDLGLRVLQVKDPDIIPPIARQ